MEFPVNDAPHVDENDGVVDPRNTGAWTRSENITPPSVPPPFQKIFSVLVGVVPEVSDASMSHCVATAVVPFQYDPSNPSMVDKFPLVLVAVAVFRYA